MSLKKDLEELIETGYSPYFQGAYGNPETKWSVQVMDEDGREHSYYGPTLKSVVKQALNEFKEGRI